jgi:membrane-associated protein
MEMIHWALEWVRELKPMLVRLSEAEPMWFYLVVFAIIFAETGLVIAPFLPGDSLLFLVGAIIAGSAVLSLPLMIGLLIFAAVLGDAVNYAIGSWCGPKVFRTEQSWLFNRNHLLRAQSFYERYGAKTIILARFIPIVRTFAPFVAGIGRMRYSRFAFYNVVGAIFWIVTCVGAGYYFGSISWVEANFEWVVVAIILISVLPMVVEFLFASRQSTKAPEKKTPPSELSRVKTDAA